MEYCIKPLIMQVTACKIKNVGWVYLPNKNFTKEIQAGTLDIDFLQTNMDNLWKVYAWKEAEKFMEQNANKYGFDYKKEE